MRFLSPRSEAGKRKRKRTLKDKARERRRKRPSPAERGYDRHHKALRQRLAPFVAVGAAVCARCGKRILPGERWDLGHDDRDRSRYTGPEHARCNRSTSTKRRTSRDW